MRKQTVELKDQCKLAIGMGHFPYKSVGGHGDATKLSKFYLEDMMIGHVDAYFAGHDHHIGYEGRSMGTDLIVSGSAGKLHKLEEKPAPGNYAEAFSPSSSRSCTPYS